MAEDLHDHITITNFTKSQQCYLVFSKSINDGELEHEKYSVILPVR